MKRESLSNVFERVINIPLGSLPSPVDTNIDSPLENPKFSVFKIDDVETNNMVVVCLLIL